MDVGVLERSLILIVQIILFCGIFCGVNNKILNNASIIDDDTKLNGSDPQNGKSTIKFGPRILPPKCHWKSGSTSRTNATTPPTDITSSACQCDISTGECVSLIQWMQPTIENFKADRKGYRIKFLKDTGNPNDYFNCFPLSKDARTFNFTFNINSTVISKVLEDRDDIPFYLGAEPIQFRVSMPYNYVHCRRSITIDPELPNNLELFEGHAYTFTCKFTGFLDLTNITWTHDDIVLSTTSRNRYVSMNEYSIEHGPQFTSLTIKKVSRKYEGSYTCCVVNSFGRKDTSRGSIIKVNTRLRKQFRGLRYIIAGGLFSVVLLISAAIYGAWKYQHKSKANRLKNDGSESRKLRVYISHFSDSEQSKKELLKFAYHLEKRFPNIAVIVDLTRRIEINEYGGLAQWIPHQMANAFRILVVLSKEYLAAVGGNEDSSSSSVVEDNDQIYKVLTEFRFIEHLLHQNFHVSDKLILAWLSEEDRGELPQVFQGRNCYILSKVMKNFRGSSFAQLLASDDQLENLAAETDTTVV